MIGLLKRDMSKTISSGPPRRPEPLYSYQEDPDPTLVWDVLYAGESGWTVPWAVWKDKNGQHWISIDQPLRDDFGGTVSMYVRNDDKYGIQVEVSGDTSARYWETESHKRSDNSIRVTKIKIRKDWY